MIRATPLLMTVFLAGCSANVVASPEPTDSEPSVLTGSIIVSRTSTGIDAHGDMVARFVRIPISASREAALGAVGASLTLPAVGSCLSLANAPAAPQFLQPLELADIGGVRIEADGKRFVLEPRRIPNIVDWTHGVVYSTRGELRGQNGAYLLSIDQKSERADDHLAEERLVSFVGEPANVKVDGNESGAISGGMADLTWNAEDTGDLIYVDVLGSPEGTRCAFADVGTAQLSELPESGSLVVHRLHRESLHTAQLSEGEIRFDFGRSINFKRK